MEKKYLNDYGLMQFWGKIKSYIKSVSDALQGQIDDKQQQITANKSAQDAKNVSLDENMAKLNTRDDQITETLKNISATGGASVASAVTYDNTTSQLTSANIQGAVDELQGAKIDKTSILQESGDAEDKVMSQKAVSNSDDKIKTLLNSVEKDILGESILEYEVAVTGKYINITGLEYSQSNSIITKPIQLYAGDKIKMIANDSGFAIIAKPKVDEKYTPVYIYYGKNKLREYVVTEDMLVCFTIVEGSKITIVNGGISKNISEINPKLDYAYDAILRTERGKKNILSVSDIKDGDVVDIVLLPDYSYEVSNYSADNSAISIFVYNKTSSSYEERIVGTLQYGHTVIISVSKKVEAIAIKSTSTNIKFDINIINGIVNRVELVEDAVSPRSIKDNLQSDGSIKRIADCIKNGKADSDYYGKENTRYKLNVKSGFDKLYMYFEWRATSAIDTRDTNKPIVLFSALNGYARTYMFFEGLRTNNANLYRAINYGRAPRGKYSYSNPLNAPSDNNIAGKIGEKYHNFVGMDALWIRYTGSASSASMKLLQDGIEFTLGDRTEKVTAKSGDLLLEVCQKVDAIQDIECSLINGADNKTYNDVFYEDTLSIPLKYTFTSSNGMTMNDSPRIYIPLKYDEKWHSCEVLVDVSKKIMYVNHDGFTVVTDLTTFKNGSNTIDYSEGLNNAIKSDICEICIGEDYNEGNIPLVFRNLEIEVGSDGGAEIIEARCPIPTSAGTYDKTGIIQMISNHNPRVVLYEGHGILVGNDNDFPASENESFVSERSMSCTTGRLMRLFEYAKNKGYEFVSWQDVVDWKINGKTLPKRSMSLMFDDFRVENYLDYDKRIPFRKFNVKPALCLITSTERFPLDGTITVNDKTYTRKEAIEMCKTAGWYMTSHSHDHRNQDEIQPSAQIALLKTDALMADEYNINSDIITYGGSNFRFYNLSAMKASSFSMGVNGMSQDYICKAINNFYINRVDIGLRLNWENVIAPLA